MAALTTASGENYTKVAAIEAGTLGVSSFVDGTNLWGTKARIVFDKYTVPTDTVAAGGVITIGRVPKGARVLGFMVTNTAAATGAVTADLQLVDAAGNITTATAAEAWTDMQVAQGLWIPALSAGSATALDEAHTVTVTTKTAILDAAMVLTVATVCIYED